MSDTVRLDLPAEPELLILPRLVTAAVAARAELGVDDIEDLRLAVDELCLSVMGEGDGSITLELTREGASVQVSCTFHPASGAEPSASGLSELSSRILDALVDDHAFEDHQVTPRAWLRKTSAASRG